VFNQGITQKKDLDYQNNVWAYNAD
jgi:hypothetical protein